jgi:hypothetical protein
MYPTILRKKFQVKAVLSKIDELTKQLADDQSKREKHDETVGIDIYKRESSHTSLKSDNSSFMWFQLFVEVLLRMTHSSTSISDLTELCKKGNLLLKNLRKHIHLQNPFGGIHVSLLCIEF